MYSCVEYKRYKILIVDDSKVIHQTTKLQLEDLSFADSIIEIFTAYSAKEAKAIINKHNDIALAIIDVAMETSTAGLDLVNYIRNEQKNRLIRLVIRTSQTDEYPAIKVIQKYDIDDFMDKAVVSKERLYATVRSSLRHYKQMIDLEDKYKNTYKQMTTNSITMLPNRIKFYEDSVDEENRTLVLIDIVSFSIINETGGYDTGDYVLKELGGFLQSMYGYEFNVYHLDSDLFGLITKDNFEENIFDTVEKIKEDISKLHIATNNFNQTLSTTIGVAYHSENNLMRKAELALREARSNGKNQIKYYSDDLKIIQKFNEVKEWTPKLRAGLTNGNVKAYFQPIYDLNTNEIFKYEMLIRLQDGEKLHAPIKFLQAAVEGGMMYDIFKFMFNQACIEARKSGKKFSVNISDSEFKSEGIVEFIDEKIKYYEIQANQISLEILENNPINKEKDILETVKRIHDLGVDIIVDDFGIECSNFGQIEFLPIDIIKIDGSFIKNLAHCENSQSVVKSVKAFADDKKIKLVAEFISNKSVYDKVMEYGIHYGQGYYLGKPSKDIYNIEKDDY